MTYLRSLVTDPVPARSERRGRSRAAVALLAALALTTACFSEHSTPTEMEPDAQLTCADVPPEGRTGADPVVVIREFAFHPAELSVSPGTTVTWINCEGSGGAAHTTTSDAGLWDSGLLGPDGTPVFQRTFQEGGDFDYHCTPHPFMQATVRVAS